MLARAEAVLKLLEEGDQGSAVRRLVEDLPLFAAARPKPPVLELEPEPSGEQSELRRVLDAADPDALTPREALDLLYRLKRLAGDEG